MNQPSRGLVGLFKRAAGGFGESLVFVLVFFAVGAAILSIIEATNGKAGTPLEYWKLLFLGFAAIIAELLGLKKAIAAWWKAQPMSTVAWTAIWAVGFGFSLYGAFFAAGNFQAKREGIQKAAHVKELNASDQLDSAKSERKRIEGRLGWMNTAVNGKPVRAIEAADADIANMKTKREWDATDGCTDVRGKNTRMFCDNYAALLTEKSLAGEKVTLNEELKKAKADIARYEVIVASGGQATLTDATPFVEFVSNVVGVDRKIATMIEPMQAALSNMLLVSFAGLVMGLSAVEGSERKRWFRFNIKALAARLRRAWDGTDHTEHHYHTLHVARDANGHKQIMVGSPT